MFSKMTKEDAELMTYKELTVLVLKEFDAMDTSGLFKKITEKLGKSKKYFEDKIGDYYTILSNDKRFILLDDAKWDLSERYSSDLKKKRVIEDDDEDEEDDIEEFLEDEDLDESEEDEDIIDEYSAVNKENDDFEDDEEDLKGLVVIDENELEEE